MKIIESKRWTTGSLLFLLPILGFLSLGARAQGADLGIFGVGITNITPSGGRLVFTTTLPAKATVTVSEDEAAVKTLSETVASLIHSTELTGLIEGKNYNLSIEAKAEGGTYAKAGGFTLTPKRPIAKTAPFEGRTYFGAGHVDDVALAKKLGAGMVRVEATWEWLVPEKDDVNYVNRDKLIKQVKAIKEAGMEPLILLAYSADWGQKYTNDQLKWRNRTFGPPDDVADWKFYCRTVMKGLKGVAKYYEVFNEPDAGYLADGKPLERDDVAGATGNKVYAGNNNYWLGDRYVPMIMATREVADAVDPSIEVLAPAWNHDYHGTRGDLLFSRGAQDYFQTYSFHNYVSQPHSYGKWQEATLLYMNSAKKVFDKYNSPKPIAVSEWGIQTFEKELPPGDLSSRSDGQVFFLKSAFFYLALERVKLAIVHQLGYNDPWSLVNKDAAGNYVFTPAFDTYSWICKTFSGKPYKRLPLVTNGDETVRAVAISVPGDKAVYIAAWQDRSEEAQKANSTQPARNVTLRLSGLAPGTYSRTRLDVVGKEMGKDTVQVGGALWEWSENLPEASGQAESAVVLFKLTP